jgi:hypothetical protein
MQSQKPSGVIRPKRPILPLLQGQNGGFMPLATIKREFDNHQKYQSFRRFWETIPKSCETIPKSCEMG